MSKIQMKNAIAELDGDEMSQEGVMKAIAGGGDSE